MHFPLPADTFPPLELSEHDAEALKRVEATFVDEALRDYDEFYEQRGGIVDLDRWKLVKKRGAVTVYLDRELRDSRQGRNVVQVGSMTFSSKLHGLWATGTVVGKLDDIMYGLVHSTNEVLAVKGLYTGDKVGDSKVLALIVPPTVAEPLRALQISWCVGDFVPSMLHSIVRPRDFLYLEAVGQRTTRRGERIVYHFLHSIDIPSVPELREHQIVRANFSMGVIFHETPDGQVSLFVKGFVDALGDIHQSVAVPATTGAMLSFQNAAYCGEMKKLTFLLRQRKVVPVARVAGTTCCGCDRKLKTSVTTVCELCLRLVCASCRQTHKLGTFVRSSRTVSVRQFTICVSCMATVKDADAREIAAVEAQTRSSDDLSTEGLSDIVSPSSSTAPSIGREFFG